MIPELFHLGPLSISPFGPAMVVAFLAAFFQLRWGMRQFGLGDDEDASALLLAAGIWGIVGAKLYYAMLYGDWRLLLDRSGLVWYGGFILGAAAFLWTANRRDLDRWRALDAATPALALGYGIGRIGCFLVGDDYGRPTDLPWGVAFPYGLPGPTTAGFLRTHYGADVPASIPADQLITVHPTQLYEAAAGITICLIGRELIRRRARAGTVALAVFGLLALERLGTEFLRLKDDRFFGVLTLAQVLSLALLLVVFLLWRIRQGGEARSA